MPAQPLAHHLPPEPARVRLTRGDRVEIEHLLRIAIVSDTSVTHIGAAGTAFHLRSSAKPLQALACIVTGASEQFEMTQAEIALAAASHNGETFHTAAVAAFLERLGLDVSHLLCGAHAPVHEGSRNDLVRAGITPTALHNNCSGKHAAMLAACLAAGWPVEEYVAPDHPLQQLNLQHLAVFAGLDPDEISIGTDGCSVPVFSLPVEAGARAFARFVGAESTALSTELRAAAGRIADAVAAHPEMIAGTGRIDTDLGRATGGRVIAKVGAEGAWCLGVRDLRCGIAIKCEDGARRAATPAGLEVLRRIGALHPTEAEQLAAYTDPVLRNHRGLEVGRVEVLLPEGLLP